MSEAIVSTIGAVACGLLFAGLGGYMVATGDPSLLHGYHYATTPPAERPALARESGGGLIATGVGCALMGASNYLGVAAAGAGIALLVGGIAFALVAIIKHNGTLFSFAPTYSAARGTQNPQLGAGYGRGIVIGGAVFGAAISLTTLAPGVYMLATGDVSMLHSYHYATIAAADLPAFSVAEGTSMIGLGIGLFLCCLAGAGMVGRFARRWTKVVMVVGGVICCAGLASMLVAIVAFGGSLT